MITIISIQEKFYKLKLTTVNGTKEDNETTKEQIEPKGIG